MTTTYEIKNTEPSGPTQDQMPVVYVYGSELADIRQKNVEELAFEGMPHEPWHMGVAATNFLGDIDDFKDKLRAEGYTEQGIEQRIAEERAEAYEDLAAELALISGGSKERITTNFPQLEDIEELGRKTRERFTERAGDREQQLHNLLKYFTARMEFAIEYSDLPITKDQFHARLEGLRLGFHDPWNCPDSTTVAGYSAMDHSITVDIDLPGEYLERVVFHELFHAISGNRVTKDDDHFSGMHVRRLGLVYSTSRQRSNTRTWLNEAVTDTLANIFFDTDFVDFGSTVAPLPVPIVFSKEEALKDYNAEIVSLSRVFSKVPAHTLLRAYFAQDNDPFEEDQRAGIHAERELWRALKIAGGAERVKELRLLEHGFKDGESKKRTLEVTQKIERQDKRRSPRKRCRNERAVMQNTNKRTQMIKVAKDAYGTKDVRPPGT